MSNDWEDQQVEIAQGAYNKDQAEEEVMENWDDSSDSEVPAPKPVPKSVPVKKKPAPQEQLPDDPLLRKQRLEEIQKATDLKHAQEMFGNVSLDPSQYSDQVVAKFASFKVPQKQLQPILEKMFRSLVQDLDPINIRKIASALNTFANDKQRPVKKKSTQKQAQVRIAASDDYSALGSASYAYDDGGDDDFM